MLKQCHGYRSDLPGFEVAKKRVMVKRPKVERAMVERAMVQRAKLTHPISCARPFGGRQSRYFLQQSVQLLHYAVR